MTENPRHPDVVKAARSLAAGLVNPSLLVTLHRDIDKLSGLDGRNLGAFDQAVCAPLGHLHHVVRGA
ncbi:hypothetical protein [Arthrobacter pigmenti]